jgi:hypothetical protein
MNVSLQQLIAVVALSSTITTAIFWGAYFIGKAMSRIERLEEKVDDHAKDIRTLKGLA